MVTIKLVALKLEWVHRSEIGLQVQNLTDLLDQEGEIMLLGVFSNKNTSELS